MATNQATQKPTRLRAMVLYNHVPLNGEVAPEVVEGALAEVVPAAAADAASAEPEAENHEIEPEAENHEIEPEPENSEIEPEAPAPEELDAALAGMNRVELEVYDVARALMEEGGFEISSVNIEDDIARLEAAITVHNPDLVFNLVEELEHDNTQHVLVASFLDLHGYLYTGSPSIALALCQDRSRMRALLSAAGIPAPGYAVVRRPGVVPDVSHLRFPLIVTQAFDDIYAHECLTHPVGDVEALRERVAALSADYEMPLLIEEAVLGRRIHVVAMGNNDKLELLPLTETDISTPEATAPEIDPDAEIVEMEPAAGEAIRALAREAFLVMGCRDWAQIDLHLDQESGSPRVIDVRPMVDLADTGPFCVAAGATQPGFDGTIVTVAKVALDRAGVAMPPKPVPLQPPPEEADNSAEPE